MKTVLLGALLLFVRYGLVAQNLVPNPSFEEHLDCPAFGGDIEKATGWKVFRGTPDYFNSCNTVGLGIPINVIGHQAAKSGNAYGGVVTYLASDTNAREHVGIQLLQPLIFGKRYYVSVFLSRADTFSFFGASNKFGFRFSTVEYSESNPTPVDNFCHVQEAAVITDNINWIRISGSFVADSLYEFVALGNFYDDANTDTINCPVYAYYYVDDVCISDDSIFNESWTGVSHQPVSAVSVYPNPASGVLYVQSPGKIGYSIVDVLGRKAMEGSFENSAQIDVRPLPSGVYIVSVKSGNKTKRQTQMISR